MREILIVENRLDELGKLAPLVESFAQRHELSCACQFQINLILDELLTNVISYGFAQPGGHQIQVELDLEGDVVVIAMEDDGVPFDLTQQPTPDVTAPPEKRSKPVGGLGIHLVRSLADHIDYRREQGRNYLVLRKKLGRAGAARKEQP